MVTIKDVVEQNQDIAETCTVCICPEGDFMEPNNMWQGLIKNIPWPLHDLRVISTGRSLKAQEEGYLKFRTVPGWLRVEAKAVFIDQLYEAQNVLGNYEANAHKMPDAEKQEVLQQIDQELHYCRQMLGIFAKLKILPEYQLHHMDELLCGVQVKHKKLLDRFLSTY